MQDWWLYMLHCADGSLYTGITTSVLRRLQEHNEGAKGARYTRARRPVRLLLATPAGDRASASRLEAALKSLSRAEKLQLLQGLQPLPGLPLYVSAGLTPKLDGPAR